MQTVAACVLALDQGRIVIVEQYRASLGQVQHELPGGNIEPGETPEQTARRELLEETGYACTRLEWLGQAPVWGKMERDGPCAAAGPAQGAAVSTFQTMPGRSRMESGLSM